MVPPIPEERIQDIDFYSFFYYFSHTLSLAPNDGEYYRKLDSIANAAFQDSPILRYNSVDVKYNKGFC